MNLTTILICLLAVLLTTLAARATRSTRTRPRRYDRHLLDSQFARGEVSIDEYLRRRRPSR